MDNNADRPQEESRQWGYYKCTEYRTCDDGVKCLSKILCVEPGRNLSYQRHFLRDEYWTIVDGEGEMVLDGCVQPISRGDMITIPAGSLHSVIAHTFLVISEVQMGLMVEEFDIERFPLPGDLAPTDDVVMRSPRAGKGIA